MLSTSIGGRLRGEDTGARAELGAVSQAATRGDMGVPATEPEEESGTLSLKARGRVTAAKLSEAMARSAANGEERGNAVAAARGSASGTSGEGSSSCDTCGSVARAELVGAVAGGSADCSAKVK